ncbi:MAG: bifunctional adenosylcobinamide kinase/adenosylcobinamide-phosphate guanylyltransferase [Hoeflea sp.]|uniref:bifunctional adenosylcobinamide kinase/adenosylcobinamide-phosphate guanylyltransferase n=1 Tax=Hoeflea sp. TaxID=1940281 RepID=UPI001D2D8DAB|nr:bifunctional adenosylcobinamide kinase/adenosylcobinamide-phosphate guanylyltransferase [Hoeflea sp.]MBU4531065.1 bifunctional adenosylcobinamide kinase/adenosylcobinamide-phosphate guanylyltransferase [Alphaproteobacteria bacterium]MBU4542840.1 bifunctional adenosylcobinamide kinase/adenosylcobinamide-phosphate guanylyltransferase [Alphaproteobacteria bacterium]MBU4552652.1 bifunctional adenosylcobinamide kinase/adenosylcobinamide-phosphate guanylyltransferase [Alphaproteobacteria bacterium]
MSQLRQITLVLGGARSGKSAFAERLVEQASPTRLYVATGQAWDDEMRERIASHQSRRGEGWETVEAPLDLSQALSVHARPDRPILVDCLTLWVTNLMLGERDIAQAFDGLSATLPGLKGAVVFVSNEVGLGIVPDNAMARAFRDHAGRLHQSIAGLADEVHFVAAGLPLKMKG